MSGELVSVVIPTYNRAHCVAEAVDSVLAQTHRRVEVVVVDDGSSDGTPALLERRYGSDPRVRSLRQENRGVSAARNVGLRVATGDYVALLDSDDVWKPWKLELQLRCLAHFADAGMIWTDMEAVDPNDRVVSARYLRTMYRASYRWFPSSDSLFSQSVSIDALVPAVPPECAGTRAFAGDLSSAMIMGNLVHTSTVLLRRERLERVGGFDEGLKVSGEDFDFHLRTCLVGPVAFADVPSIRYRVGADDQLTGPGYGIHLARNFLRTIEPVLRERRDAIDLPASMLAAVQAEAHAWVGKESLAQGHLREARRHLAASLRHRALAPATLLLFAMSHCPRFTYPWARAVVRASKRALGILSRARGRRV
jgi:GT2 family glycosyltransferase